MEQFVYIVTILLHLIGLSIGKGPPEITQGHKVLMVSTVGGKIRIPCPVQSDPEAFVEWKKETTRIHEGWERFKMKERFLRIRNVHLEDTGVYICTATNGFGTVTAKIFLFVKDQDGWKEEGNNSYSAPRFFEAISESSQISITRGASLTLDCRAGGNPFPNIAWFHADRPLSITRHSHPPFDWNTNSDTRWFLNLQNLEQTDSGKYSCVVWNSVGIISQDISLKVQDEIIMKKEPLNNEFNVYDMTKRSTSTTFLAILSILCFILMIVMILGAAVSICGKKNYKTFTSTHHVTPLCKKTDLDVADVTVACDLVENSSNSRLEIIQET